MNVEQETWNNVIVRFQKIYCIFYREPERTKKKMRDMNDMAQKECGIVKYFILAVILVLERIFFSKSGLMRMSNEELWQM